MIRLDHVALAVPRFEAAMPLVVGTLGGAPVDGGPGNGFRGAQWRFAGGGRLEVLEPADGDDFLRRFLEARGAGLHHATFIVPDFAKAIEHAQTLGFRVVRADESKPSWKEAFLHPKSALGIVVQLAESNPGLGGDTWSAEFPFPPSPPPLEPPVRLVGLRMRVRSIERARTLFVDLLGGTRLSDASDVVFHWPDSPL